MEVVAHFRMNLLSHYGDLVLLVLFLYSLNLKSMCFMIQILNKKDGINGFVSTSEKPHM